MQENVRAGDENLAAAAMLASLCDAIEAPRMVFDVVCRGPDGEIKWTERVSNLVTTAGKTDIIDKYLKGSSYTAAWYMLLAGSGTKAAGDTLASHAGWSEVTAYSGSRPAITWGSTSAGSNAASGVSFTMNGSYTVAGAGCCTVASGTSGTLYNVSDFSTARSGGSGDTITVTPTLSAS